MGRKRQIVAEIRHYDVIVIGAGLAGLYLASKLPKDKNVLVLCKDIPWECNTFYAQGGMVTALDKNDIPFHIEDTLNAGAHHNIKEAVEVLSRDSLEVREDFVKRGMQFDTNESGELLYTKEAAHSTERILHAGGDATGRYMHMFLMEQNPHKLQNVMV